MAPGGIKRISTLFRSKSHSKDPSSKKSSKHLQALPDEPEPPATPSTFSSPSTISGPGGSRRRGGRTGTRDTYEDFLGPVSPPTRSSPTQFLEEFDQPLTDRVVVVTGASRGIGLEFVRQLSQDPRTLIIAVIRNPETAAKLVQLTSTQVVAVHADITDEASLKAAASDVARISKGKVDLLINCAAVNTDAKRPLAEWDAEGLNQHLATNVTGPVSTINAFLPLLRKGKEKRVINLTSGMSSLAYNDPHLGFEISPSYAAYSISKCCLNLATRKYAVEQGKEGFTFVALSAGWVRTDMGGPDAPLSAKEAVAQLIKVIDGLKPADNGKFMHIDGTEIEF
ncbi:NAD(P)-binding protein [Calocera cornea HHB12733]|uniref:NAD(P)-binding protein n=1 Tax=Calocera cornea HHB12733 TaxID=1353952 RepID=A0A165CYU5_9BASI|nr:NAD(P)-binding protein [Calocera cornea HHB12733]